MVKILKIAGSSLGIIAEWLIILLIGFAFAIHLPVVQTFIVQRATNYLSKELKTEIHFDRISLSFIDEVAIDGFYILDLNKDTLLRADRLYAGISGIFDKKSPVIIHRVNAEGADVHLQRSVDSVFNHSFLIKYFKSDKPSSGTVVINLEEIHLSDSRFRYDDHTKVRKIEGIDYFHIDAQNIQAEVTQMEIDGLRISGILKHLSCDEKSGLKIEHLQLVTRINEHGLNLSNLSLQTTSSELYAENFHLITKNYPAYRNFVDSVRFFGRIDSSRVALHEVALFAPVLKGMTDTVELKGKVLDAVAKMRITDFAIRYGKNTQVAGNLYIPDYRRFMEGRFDEGLSFAKLDLYELSKLRLPDSAGQKYLVFAPELLRLSPVSISKLKLKGTAEEFNVYAESLDTKLGSILFPEGIEVKQSQDKSRYLINPTQAGTVVINQIQLGQLIAEKTISQVSGQLAIQAEIDQNYSVAFTSVNGTISQFGLNNYNFSAIQLTNASFVDNRFQGEVNVNDEHAGIDFNGSILFDKTMEYQFTADLRTVDFQKINISETPYVLSTGLVVNLSGNELSKMFGSIEASELVLENEEKNVSIPELDLTIEQQSNSSSYQLISTVVDARFDGNIDFSHLYMDFSRQLSKLLPSLYTDPYTKEKQDKIDHFTYQIVIKKSDQLLDFFDANLSIAEESSLNGHYFGESNNFTTQVSSKQVVLNDIVFSNISGNQVLDSNSLMGSFHCDQVVYNDSIKFSDVYLALKGNQNKINSDLTWEGKTTTPSRIVWATYINDWEHYHLHLEPSYFFIKGRQWDITHDSKLFIAGDTIEVQQFELSRGEQQLLVDGKFSKNKNDHLNFKLSNFQLEEISEFISNEYPLSGELNAWGYVADPFGDVEYLGDAHLKKLKVKERLIGDVFFLSEWDHQTQSVFAQGDLIYDGNQTFDFEGNYFVDREEESLDFDLIFDYTDIHFVNAFLDPKLLSEVRGILVGSVHLSGTPLNPELTGNIDLKGGSAYVDMLGVHFGVDGSIDVDEYGIYMNNIPIFDQEGNAGYLIGSVYHDNFENFNFDLLFDLERDAINKDPVYFWKVVPLKEFLIMNADYEPGSIYYGKGYATGIVNIFGYTDNLEITVDLDAKKGTMVNIPMYGVGDIDEENQFITFVKNKEIDSTNTDYKYNFTGVDLDLNFHVTQESEVKIIFNEDLGDEILAMGSGDIEIKLDNLGNIRMDGVFTVDHGVYNFVMGPIRQRFFIEEGGTINWTGDPYDANLNLRTFYKVNANIADISQDLIASGSGAHQEIYCYLDLSESLLRPSINFNIRAPQANDIARSLINRVNNDQDELNRQFFSLLLWKRFQPLANTTQTSASAAGDLIANQINSLLSMVSNEYRLNVNYNSDQLTGDRQYEFGVSKSFLNNKLILSGTFGIENQNSVNTDGKTDVIGDIRIEYLLNESGTFRVNVFNESTDKTIIQESEQGRFTQGAGVNYKEDFNNFQDFKAIQYFLDVFRTKKNKKYMKKRKTEQRPVPPSSTSYLPKAFLLPKETDRS